MTSLVDMTNLVHLCRGLPKKRLKKASKANIETSIVVATSASGMQFPHNEAVQKSTHKKRSKKKVASSSQARKPRNQLQLHQQVMQILGMISISVLCFQSNVNTNILTEVYVLHKIWN
jgi:hypothetical protein